jgi:O-antigen ligase
LQSSYSEILSEGLAVPAGRERILVLLDRTIFYGLVLVIALTAIPYGTVDPWSEALFECAIFLLTLLWAVHGFIAGSWRMGNMRIVWPMIGLVMLAIVQSIAWWKTDVAGEQVWFTISADPFESWTFAFRVAALVLAALLVIRFTSNTKRLGVLVHAIIAVALASALFGIARQVMQHQTGFLLSRLQLEQGYGQFINKNHFPYLMEMAIGLAAGVALMPAGRRDRVPLYLSGILLMGAAIILSRSRGGLLSFLVEISFAVLLFVYARRVDGPDAAKGKARPGRSRAIALAVVIIATLVAGIAGGVVWLGGDQLATGLETATTELSGTDSSEMHEGARRRDIWRATWRMFKVHPIAGAGLGGYWAEIPVYHPASGVSTPQQAHNDYLELLASGGVVGALLFVWLALALIKQARQSINVTQGFQRAVVLGAIVSIVGVGMHSIVDFGLHVTINALVLVVLLALVSLGKLPRGDVARKAGLAVRKADE